MVVKPVGGGRDKSTELATTFSVSSLLWRFVELLWLFSPVIVTAPIFMFKDWKDAHNWWFKKLRESMEVSQ